ncbi:hypothetical protein CONPUDRAFT_167530 [Coniophora puteana RWD-64-598 SS2]|uniref:DUF6533 domain-containing protein n=1 Tax=Coniophora puteana (strain RWD-64-598) TaxID=741705 RepID=A0A5M3MH27_CONPW|nr:uncharacterized protein CONPUDRAFT_167530 [Coniophora puteana RWD-64-598 SS2]EIW78538.1 hypothetical protein CONPUDRAFT_167530 [Coniophora puteana RWD-64-598 SS2]
MATMQQQQEFDALIQTVDVLQATRFCQVAAVVIVIHDYVLNFDNEIRHIWGKRFSLVTVLYLVNRYVGSIIIICDALLFTNTSFSVQVSKIFQLIACFGPFISIWSTQLIMQLRLYAMYSNSKRILSFTLTLLLLEMAGTVTVIVIWMRIITYNNRPFAPWIDSWHMCATSSPNRSLTAIYVPIFAYEMVMFGLALFAVFHKLGGIGAAVQSRTRLQATVNMLFKYSIVYFAVYFIACAVAIGMYLGLPPTYIDVLNVFLMAISVLLGSHMVLGARGFSPTPEDRRLGEDTSSRCESAIRDDEYNHSTSHVRPDNFVRLILVLGARARNSALPRSFLSLSPVQTLAVPHIVGIVRFGGTVTLAS